MLTLNGISLKGESPTPTIKSSSVFFFLLTFLLVDFLLFSFPWCINNVFAYCIAFTCTQLHLNLYFKDANGHCHVNYILHAILSLATVAICLYYFTVEK